MKFKRREETGRKADPGSVAQGVMIAKDTHPYVPGSLQVGISAGLFSRLASKKALFEVLDARESATRKQKKI